MPFFIWSGAVGEYNLYWELMSHVSYCNLRMKLNVCVKLYHPEDYIAIVPPRVISKDSNTPNLSSTADDAITQCSFARFGISRLWLWTQPCINCSIEAVSLIFCGHHLVVTLVQCDMRRHHAPDYAQHAMHHVIQKSRNNTVNSELSRHAVGTLTASIQDIYARRCSIVIIFTLLEEQYF